MFPPDSTVSDKSCLFALNICILAVLGTLATDLKELSHLHGTRNQKVDINLHIFQLGTVLIKSSYSFYITHKFSPIMQAIITYKTLLHLNQWPLGQIALNYAGILHPTNTKTHFAKCAINSCDITNI